MLVAAVSAFVFGAPAVASQQESEDERRARLERRGAGISAGVWDVRALTEVEDVDYSTSPSIEAFFAKGLDLHLALENTLGLWIRTQRSVSSDGLGGTTEETIRSYIVPQFTSIKLYPVSRPMDRVQPFVGAGAGFAIAIDDRETQGSGGGLLGGIAPSGIAMVPGFGFKGQLGTEIRGKAFGVGVSAKYQWVRFFQEVGGEQTFGGAGVDVGFVYRFQYR